MNIFSKNKPIETRPGKASFQKGCRKGCFIVILSAVAIVSFNFFPWPNLSTLVNAGEPFAGVTASATPDELQALLKEHAGNPNLLLQLGEELLKNGHGCEAESAVTSALADKGRLSDDEISQAQELLDSIYADDKVLDTMRARNDFSAMERMFTRRIEMFPRQAANNQARRGLVRRRLLKLDEALADFQAAQTAGIQDMSLRLEVQRESWTLRGSIANLREEQRREELQKQARENAANEAAAAGAADADLIAETSIADTASVTEPSVVDTASVTDSSQTLFRRYIANRIRVLTKAEKWDELKSYLEELAGNETISAQAALQHGYLQIALGDNDGADAALTLALSSGNLDDVNRLEALRALHWIGRLRPEHGDVPQEATVGRFGFLAEPANMVRLPTLPWLTAPDKLAVADSLRSQREWDGLRLVLEHSQDYSMDELSKPEQGRFLYNQGELSWASGDWDTACEYYKKGYELLQGHSFSRSNIRLRFAEHNNRKGSREAAIEDALAAAEESPGSAWIQQQVGVFLIRMGETDSGFNQLEKALELSSRPLSRADVYAAYIDGYDRLQQPDKYIEYAEKYIAEVENAGSSASARYHANVAFYKARIHEMRGEPEPAYESYEKALGFSPDKYRTSEIYWRMAENSFVRGDREQAKANAEKSLEQLPNEEWKIRQIQSFLSRLDRPERVEQTERTERSEEDVTPVIEREPERPDPLRSLVRQAEQYRRDGNEEAFIEHAALYAQEASAAERELSDSEQGLLAYYRGEISSRDGDEKAAYEAYESASGLLSDKYRLSEIFMKMAQLDLNAGRRERAAEQARKSVELLPEQAWKQREVGNFLARAGQSGEAAEHLQKAVELDKSPTSDVQTYLSLAEAYKRSGNQEKYLESAQLYNQAILADGRTPSESEQGAAAFYRAEIFADEGKSEEAYAAYEEASRIVTERYRLAEIYMNMAEQSRKNDARELSAENAVKSAEQLPDQVWKLRQVGNFLLDLNMPEAAAEYLQLSIELSASPEHDAATYASLAQAFRNVGDNEKYLEYARKFLVAVALKNGDATDREEGLRAYYQAEVHAAEGRDAEAYDEYGLAAGLTTEKYRLSEIAMKMAGYEIKNGRRDEAIASMRKSADLLPEQAWKQRQAAEFFVRNDMLDVAIEYYDRLMALDSDSRRKFEAYGALAAAYGRRGNEEKRFEYLLLQREALSSGEADSDEAEGLKAYYQARLFAAQGNDEAAYEEYERASHLISEDKERLFETLMSMAEHQSKLGNRDEAAENVRMAAELLPEDARRQRQAGNFLLRLRMPDAAVEYFDRVVSLDPDPELKVSTYGALADSFKSGRNTEKFIEYAKRFGEAISAGGRSASNPEKGRWAMYEADIYTEEGDEAKAFEARKRASGLITDSTRLDRLYTEMSRFLAKVGRKEESIEYMERSLELMRDMPWKLRQVGDLYARMDMPGKAIECYEMALEKSTAALDRAASNKSLAEIHESLRDEGKHIFYLEKYIECLEELIAGRQLTKEQQGEVHFYKGELHRVRKEPASAYKEYVEASGLLRDVYRLSETYLNIARYHAEHGGDEELAEAAMDKSVSYLPALPWKLRQAGAFFNRMGKTEKALDYYHEALEYVKLVLEKASIYRAIAEIYHQRREYEKFIEYAEKYIGVMDRESENRPLTDEEKAYKAYFTAEMHTLKDEHDLAFTEYEKVLQLSKEPIRLAEVHYRIAQYYLDKKDDKERAAESMTQSAAQLPTQGWKQRQAGDFFLRLSLPSRALSYYSKALEIASTPSEQAASHRALAEFYNRENDKEQFVYHAQKFIETLPQTGKKLSDEEIGLTHYYRAEIFVVQNRQDLALSEYCRQLDYIADKAAQSEVYLKMAELHVNWESWDPQAQKEFITNALKAQAAKEKTDAEESSVDSNSTQVGQEGALDSNADALAETPTASSDPFADKEFDAKIYTIKHRECAAFYASKAADALAEQSWRQLQVGTFFGNQLNNFHQQIHYYQRGLEVAKNSKEKAAAYSAFAEAHQRHRDSPDDVYLDYARLYIATVDEIGPAATDVEKGLSAYYQAEIYVYTTLPIAAVCEYERSLTLIRRDNARRADIYMKLAELHAAWEERNHIARRNMAQEFEAASRNGLTIDQGFSFSKECAAQYADKSAGLFPNVSGRQRQVGLFFGNRLNDYERQLYYYRRALDAAKTARERALTYREFAEVYRRGRGGENSEELFRNYVDLYIQEINAMASAASEAELSQMAYYQAEVYVLQKMPELALLAYQRAIAHTTDKSFLADIYLKIAEIHVNWESWDPQAQKVFITNALRAQAAKEKIKAGAESSANSNSTQAGQENALAQMQIAMADPFAGKEFDAKVYAIMHREYAAYYASKAADILAEQSRMQLQVGTFFGNSLDNFDRQIHYYQRGLEVAKNSKEKAAVYSAFAEAHLRHRDSPDVVYLDYARLYIATVDEIGPAAIDVEKGLSAYYQAEIYVYANLPIAAACEYERSLTLLSRDNARRADIYMKVAELHATWEKRNHIARRNMAQEFEEASRNDLPIDRGFSFSKECAALYAVKSADLFPNVSGRQRQVGLFFGNRLDDYERQLYYYHRALDVAKTARERALTYRELAGFYRRGRGGEGSEELFLNYVSLYIQEITAMASAASEAELSQMAYYQAEVYGLQNQPELALLAFQRAIAHTKDKSSLADIYLKMAEVYAKYETGDLDKHKSTATHYADISAAYLPDSSFRQREVGTFFGRIDMYSRQMHYYDRALAAAKNARERAAVYTLIAESQLRNRDIEKETYLKTARLYIKTVAEIGEEANNAEKGLSAFYQGEIYSTLPGREFDAYKAYERAVFFLEEKFRRTDALLKMAKYNADNGNGDLAALQAWEVADTLPDTSYRIVSAANIFSSLKRYDDAIAILSRAIQAKPGDNVDLYRDLARMYNSLQDRKTAAAYNAMYIDYMTDKVVNAGKQTDKKQLTDLYEARRRQVSYTRSKWKFESYLWGSRSDTGNENVGTNHKISRSFTFLGMYGSVYASIGWTLYGNYSGYYYNEYNDSMQLWNSNPRMKDSLHYRVGFNINPFSRSRYAWLRPLQLGVEYMHGLWRNKEHDLLFRVEWERSASVEPRPCATPWKYYKDKFDGLYSNRDRDFASTLSMRRGVVIPACWDANLLFVPNGELRVIQEGFRSDRQFIGLDAAARLMVRKYFREDKYHTPRAYVEMQVYYRRGLTRDRDNSFGFTMSSSF